MIQVLAAPEVIRCFFDDAFDPHLPAMCLRWDGSEHDLHEEGWELPDGIHILGPPPERFGIRIQRMDPDTYDVRLLWDRTCFHWQALSRAQLLDTCLSSLLGALGTDLWYLLDQPVVSSQ
jgi:hypothetical protein